MNYHELPEDYQCILMELCEELLGKYISEKDFAELLQQYAPNPVDISRFVLDMQPKISKDFWDYRGPEHVEVLAGIYANASDSLPPIITFQGEWKDGRHRMLAAWSLGIKSLPCIELVDFL